MSRKYSNNIMSFNGVFPYLVIIVFAKATEAQETLCGSCQATNGRFACMDETTYSFCYNSNEPDVTSTRHCPTGFYCNVNVLSICSSTTTSSPSCIPTTPTTPTTTTTSTTPSTPTTVTDSTTPTTPTTVTESTTSTTPTTPTTVTDSTTSTTTPTTSTTASVPFDPTVFCNNIQSTGNYKLESDAACKRYIYCYRLSGQLLGVQFICEDYYNASTRKCQKTKPEDC